MIMCMTVCADSGHNVIRAMMQCQANTATVCDAWMTGLDALSQSVIDWWE